MRSHPIIALWAHPRSMSTAVERIMRERGDLRCLHEPFMYDYYVNRQVREMPFFEVSKDHPATFEDVRDMILTLGDTEPVFFKDMGYYVQPRLLEEASFAKRLTHTFLIRHPAASIVSYHNLDPELTLEEIGLEAQWVLYAGLSDMGLKPVVLDADDIRENTPKAIARYWKAIGLDHMEHAFNWQNDHPDDWNQVRTWHQDVMSSKEIKPQESGYHELRMARFQSAAAEAPQLNDYLDHHLPYYERLKNLSCAY